MKTINIGMLGMGNIGTGTFNTFMLNKAAIEERLGAQLVFKKFLVRDASKKRSIDADQSAFTEKPEDIIDNPDIHIVIELMGGVEPASMYMHRALKNGKHVVTANKAAIAANGEKLAKAAAEHKVMLRYEASVGGGIPIINALTSSLNANTFDEILGIVNGTTNYILTQMTEYGLEYEDVLKDAQEKGFAEPDPTADVEGLDVANKLSILIALAFGIRIPPDQIPTTGVSGITKDDIAFATQFGYKVKLLAAARKTDAGLECHVQPTLVPLDHPLASVSNEYNAVFVQGNAVDKLMFYGKGAGPLPTGSAVMGDVIEIAQAIIKDCAWDSKQALETNSDLPFIGEGENMYYLKLMVEDRPGVLGRVSTTFGQHGVGIQSMIQSSSENLSGLNIPLYFILHKCQRSQLDAALEDINQHNFCKSIDSIIRVLSED